MFIKQSHVSHFHNSRKQQRTAERRPRSSGIAHNSSLFCIFNVVFNILECTAHVCLWLPRDVTYYIREINVSNTIIVRANESGACMTHLSRYFGESWTQAPRDKQVYRAVAWRAARKLGDEAYSCHDGRCTLPRTVLRQFSDLL